jgi:hypothetical protein
MCEELNGCIAIDLMEHMRERFRVLMELKRVNAPEAQQQEQRDLIKDSRKKRFKAIDDCGTAALMAGMEENTCRAMVSGRVRGLKL